MVVVGREFENKEDGETKKKVKMIFRVWEEIELGLWGGQLGRLV